LSTAALFALCHVLLVTGCNSGPYTSPPDATPPTAPANLTATAASATQINLSWTASTDDIGVTGYKVERCSGAGCSSFTQIATPTATTFNDTGLTASTSYSYRVHATDAANNLSGFSSIATASTPAAGAISVSISPRRGGVVTSQTLPLTATVTNDVGGVGVTWTKTGGTFTNPLATTVTFSSTAAGSFTITATSNADNTKSALVTIGVTDLTGVTTYHNNLSRDGTNTREFALTTSNVATSTFGKRFSCPVDGAVYAQPLWVPNLTIGGGTHNVIFVATQHDSVYAFDADNGNGTTCTQYWKVSLLNGGTPVNPSDTNEIGDISGEIGITGTPVIDAAAGTLYVVSKTKEGSIYHQRLHALNLTTGIPEKPGAPLDLTTAITVPGDADTGDSSVGCTSATGSVPFCPLRENQRAGLVLANGTVYVTWAAHGDVDPYHGWVMGFDASTLARSSTFNATPNSIGSYARAGIWMAGGAPAVDASNNLYVITGNGTWNGTTNFGDSFLKLNSALSVSDWFTPFNQSSLDGADLDLGSGGAVVLVDLPSSAFPQVLVGGGKGSSFNGEIYVLNRQALGHMSANDSAAVQVFALGGGIFATAAFWQNKLYIAGANTALKSFAISPSTSMFNTVATSQSPTTYGFPGATPSVSSSPTGNGIVWAIDSSQNGKSDTNLTRTAGPAVLHAYDATKLATEIWNSSQAAGGRDTAGNAVKFTVPTVANGKVYIGTRGNDNTQGSGTIMGQLDVYGLLP